MLKAIILILAIFIAGCAAYSYKTGSKDLGGGYVISRNSYPIPEYTIGKDKKAPQDKKLAEARFKRRKGMVEYYYKQMGFLFHEPMQFMHTFGETLLTPVRLPGVVVNEHRYQTDKEYSKKVDAQEDEWLKSEQARVDKWQVKLDEFIKDDLKKEEAQDNANQTAK